MHKNTPINYMDLGQVNSDRARGAYGAVIIVIFFLSHIFGKGGFEQT